MENKKQGGTPKDCESLHFFIADKEKRVRVTVLHKYEKDNQYEMFFEKYPIQIEERVHEFQPKKTSILGFSKQNLKGEETIEKSEQQVANLGSYVSKPWIEKYRPSKAYELLAPEYQVRQILVWLKNWDQKINKTRLKSGMLRKSEKLQDNLKEKELKDVLLLSGATGIGKTTIASLTTKQIGFKSTIMTPSTARTAEKMVQMIKNTTQTHRIDSETGQIEKGALIVDELDTASEGQVKQIEKALLKRGKIRRPVICIVTNPFLPSIKELREKSMWIHIYENAQEKLLSFLKGVCKRELILVDEIYLLDIMSYMEGDIRLCLEALQKLYERGRKLPGGGVKLTFKDIEAMDFEKVRDKFSSAHSILKGIMLKPSTTAGTPAEKVLKIKDLDGQLGSFTEVSKITDGLYNNLFLESKSVFRGLELISSFLD